MACHRWRLACPPPRATGAGGAAAPAFRQRCLRLPAGVLFRSACAGGRTGRMGQLDDLRGPPPALAGGRRRPGDDRHPSGSRLPPPPGRSAALPSPGDRAEHPPGRRPTRDPDSGRCRLDDGRRWASAAEADGAQTVAGDRTLARAQHEIPHSDECPLRRSSSGAGGAGRPRMDSVEAPSSSRPGSARRRATVMRRGQNPAKFVREVAQPARLTVAVLTYAPFLGGFFAEALDVIRACLESLWRATPAPYDLLVFDNGSCREVVDYLLEARSAGRIQHLMLSQHNLGKGGAWNVIFQAAPGELLAYTDCDALFFDGWLEPSLEILETYPRVGMVTARPFRTPEAFLTRTLAWGEADPQVRLERRRFIPSDT